MGTLYGPVQWPPRSPDLTHLDYLFWGYLKTTMYVTTVPTSRKSNAIAATQSELLQRWKHALKVTAIIFNSSLDCTTPNNENGVCIYIRQCEKLNNLRKYEKQSPSVRTYLQNSYCGYDGKNKKYCCPQEKKDQDSNKSTVQPKPSNSLSSSILPSNRICGKVMIDNNNDRIVGGRPSKLGAWPWLAAIGYTFLNQKNPPIHWSCGGSLITNKHVLTAAHCLVNLPRYAKPTTVRLGDLDLDPNAKDGATPLDVPIDQFIAHERYFQGGKNVNDIGILILKSSVTFNDHIQPICLPSKSDASINYKKTPVISGWGATKPSTLFNGRSLPNTKLMEVELPLINNVKCKTAYANKTNSLIDDTVLCAGFLEGKKDSCRGDSGGPLMLTRRPQYYVIGIVSYGPKECGAPGLPGVYTRVPIFIDWIRTKLTQI